MCDDFRIQSSRDYEQVLKTIMRLVKRLSNDTVEELMEYKDELASDLVQFLNEMASLIREGAPHMMQAARDFKSKYFVSFLILNPLLDLILNLNI